MTTLHPGVAPVDPAGTYNLLELLPRIGPPSLEELEAFSISRDSALLVEMGVRISSEKILTDGTRWLGQVYTWTVDSTEAKQQKIGFCPGQARVFAADLGKLHVLLARRQSGTTEVKNQRAVARAEADTTTQTGKEERETVFGLLRNAALGDAVIQEAVNQAYGVAPEPVQVADSLERMANLGDKLLAAPDKQPAKRLKLVKVGPARFQAARDLAQQVRRVAMLATGAGTTTDVTQAELDEQDGVVLTHMGALMHLFNGAHESDPTIPALTPIATRSVFARWRRKAATPETPVPAPTP